MYTYEYGVNRMCKNVKEENAPLKKDEDCNINDNDNN